MLSLGRRSRKARMEKGAPTISEEMSGQKACHGSLDIENDGVITRKKTRGGAVRPTSMAGGKATAYHIGRARSNMDDEILT